MLNDAEEHYNVFKSLILISEDFQLQHTFLRRWEFFWGVESLGPGGTKSVGSCHVARGLHFAHCFTRERAKEND